MIHANDINWLPWEVPNGSVVSQIRFSTCGDWIEKEYYDEDVCQETLHNQREDGTLKCGPGTTGYSYVSQAVETLDEDFANMLFDNMYLNDHQDLIFKYEDKEWDDFIDDCITACEFAGLCHKSYHKDIVNVWDAAHESEDLAFGDMHWFNVGYLNGAFVCIDFDTHNYVA